MNGSNSKFKIVAGLLLLTGALFAGWSQFNQSGDEQLVLEDTFASRSTAGRQATETAVAVDATVNVATAAAPAKVASEVPVAPPRRRSSREEVIAPDSSDTIEVNVNESQEWNASDSKVAASSGSETEADIELFSTDQEATVPVSINHPESRVADDSPAETELPVTTSKVNTSSETDHTESTTEDELLNVFDTTTPVSDDESQIIGDAAAGNSGAGNGIDESFVDESFVDGEDIDVVDGDIDGQDIVDESTVPVSHYDSNGADRQAGLNEAREDTGSSTVTRTEGPVVHKLHNPTQFTVVFLVSGVEHRLAPGEAIEFTPGFVRYHRGGAFGDMQTRLESGSSYEFSVTRANGWKIDKIDN